MITLNSAVPSAKGGNTGLIIGAIALAALGYYFLVYKPKQEAEELAKK